MKQIILSDRLYGEFIITSPVIIALLNSAPINRLKKITQYGTPYKIHHLKQFTRYDHSIGVMLLLRSLGATEEEQIAGLLHDVSHTAFSHVIDWVVGNEHEENYQDLQHKDFINNSEIADILTSHNYDPKRISHYKHFTLLEKNSPDLCADRVDYALREFKQHIAKRCLEKMVASDGTIIFTDQSAALLFATYFLKKQMTIWGSYESATRYHFLAKALQIALRKKIITFSDFWTYDKLVLDKVTKANDKEINHIFTTLIRIRDLSQLPKTDLIYYPRFRYVDPYIVTNNEKKRLTLLDPVFKKTVETERQKHAKGICIPLLPQVH